MKKGFRQIPFKSIIIEIISVIFAVLCALGINEYWETRSNNILAKQSLNQIIEEIQSNKKAIEGNILNHQKAIENIQNEITEIESTKKFKNTYNVKISSGMIRNTAWTTTKTLGIVSFFKLEDIQALTVIYDLQEIQQAQMNRMLAMLGSIEYQEADPGVILRTNETNHNILLNIEKQLSEAYQDFLDNIGIACQ